MQDAYKRKWTEEDEIQEEDRFDSDSEDLNPGINAITAMEIYDLPLKLGNKPRIKLSKQKNCPSRWYILPHLSAPQQD